MDYTQYEHPERELTGGRWNDGVWWAPREEAIRRQKLAEAEYSAQRGKRTKYEHLLNRFCERNTEGYGIGAVMWRDFITVYLNNVTIFSTVWDDDSVTLDGWLYNHEILAAAIQMDDIGNRIITRSLHPMSEPYVAR